MTSIHLSHVSFSYSTAVPVLSDVDLDLGPGWYGVVGANGAGKTTFLQLVSDQLRPTSGTVTRAGVSTLAAVPQETIARPEAVATFALRWDGDAARLRSRLGLDPSQLDRWATLSPGERSRWAIAAALAEQPDLLLLDEPTNHIDASTRALLVEALADFDGIGLLISHDRTLLDGLTSRTLRVHGGTVRPWSGSYSSAREAWELADRQLREAHERSRREERRLKAEVARLAQAKSGAERGSAERRRTAGHRDHDAHSTARKERAANAAAAYAQRTGAAARRLDRQEAATAALDVERTRGGDVTLSGTPSARDTLLALRCETLPSPDGAPLLHDLDLHVGPRDRIHVRGDNGSGKTTLVRALLDQATLEPEDLVALPQELDDTEVAELLRSVTDLDPARRGRVFGIAANLGADPHRLLITDRPSPGEARKLALALALDGSAALVVLDEPTNHLDLPAIERLEAALEDYDGALLVITHDERLAARVTTSTWELRDGRVRTEAPIS